MIKDLDGFLRQKPHSLLEATARELTRLNCTKVGLLASPTSINEGLHARYLPEGTQIITLDDQGRKETSEIIHTVIRGELPHHKLLELIGRLKRAGADHIILGCTELSLLKDHFVDEIKNIIDPVDLLVNEIVSEGDDS